MIRARESHEFAIYFSSASPLSLGEYTLTDKDLYHRITRILRLQKDELIILFDRDIRVHAEIKSIDRTSITLKILEKKNNPIFKPSIHFLLPLLKRDAFEEAVYGLVEAGVNEIQPVITEKTNQKWGGKKEQERLQRIMIAAAEQSKCYRFAHMHEPKSLNELLESASGTKFFFDAAGAPFIKTIEPLLSESPELFTVLIGPEGDLTAHEKKQASAHNFTFVSLTPTILRARQAAFATAVMIRSLF